MLSLFTYDPADPSFNHAVGPKAQVQNGAGLVGSYMAGFLVDFFGLGAFYWPAVFFLASLNTAFRNVRVVWWRWAGCALFFTCMLGVCASQALAGVVRLGFITGGGFFGDIVYGVTVYYLRPAGAFLVWLFASIIAFQLISGLTWGRILGSALSLIGEIRLPKPQAPAGLRTMIRPPALRLPKFKPPKRRGDSDDDGTPADQLEGPHGEADQRVFAKMTGRRSKGEGSAPAAGQAKPPAKKAARKKTVAGPTTLPGVDMLDAPPAKNQGVSKDLLQSQSESVSACLADFGIQGEIQAVEPGPVVTMFEFKPAPGVKISRIAGLSDDLALALKAAAVRVEAPLPGRDTVGIEIPNENRQTVYLREIMDSKTFRDASSKLTLALGKNIHGEAAVADLAKMPHLLVAGATGAGKSVCLNTILLSFLYKASPDDVKLLLVDPKRIELAVYADLPHLVHPVVTDMALAKNALDWAVHEMERRYEAMARLGVRNIAGYNSRLETMGDETPEELGDLEPMPYLVIIIDELADLMMTGAKEVEMSIVRLAQLARAAGIHMILATQRPSVDVVTGLIKANFPSRISFQVTSKHDSRTILDSVGAEHLLGKGDMLYKPSGGKAVRLHGAFVGDAEIAEVVGFWKSKAAPGYRIDFEDWRAEEQDGVAAGGGAGAGSLADDPQYAEAVTFVMENGKASISLIQRRFRIGFNKAARYVEQMEQDGVIGPQDGTKPRTVLRKNE